MGRNAWDEYDAAASWCSRRGSLGNIGDPLPPMLSAEVLALIADDPRGTSALPRAVSLEGERVSTVIRTAHHATRN